MATLAFAVAGAQAAGLRTKAGIAMQQSP